MEGGLRGQCETHQLPLDARGECELCRLSAIPSNAPPSRALSWLVIVGAVLLLGAAVFAFGMTPDREAAPPQRGVPVATRTIDRPPPSERSVAANRQRPRSDRPTSVPVPSSRKGATDVRTAPVPARPPTQRNERKFTEADAREALGQVRIEMYATTWCDSCRRARAYLSENGIAYTEYDIDADEDAKARLAEINPRTSIPTFRIDDIVQIGFSPESLEYKLNEAVRKRLYR